jgi:malate permease and related proteins
VFLQTCITVFSSIFQLFLICLAAGILVKRKIVSTHQVQALSAITVNVFLPCLVMAKTLIQFHPDSFSNWWILPLAGVLIIVIGFFFSGFFFKMKQEKRPFMTLASMQNAIYIVLPIGQVIFLNEFDRFALYCFLLLLGSIPMMWSLGKVMISGNKDSRIHLKDFITPPFLAMLAAVILTFTNLSSFVPGSVIAAMDLLGQATVPVATFILGATIGSLSFKKIPSIKDIIIVTMVKYVLVPVTMSAILYYGKFYVSMPLLCSMLVIQAAAPPATNLILIVKHYGGDTEAISSMMVIQYLICMVAMPLWIAAWQTVTG